MGEYKNRSSSLGKIDVSGAVQSVLGMGLNAMQWREKDHLYVMCIQWIAQSMKKWMSIAERFPIHTHNPISQCVSSNMKRTKRHRSLRTWPKLSVSRTVCVLTHKRS